MNEIGGKLRALIDDQFLYEIPSPQHEYINPCLTFYKKLYNTKYKISHLFNLEYGHIIKYASREIGWAIRHKLENNLIQWKDLSKIHNHHYTKTQILKSNVKNVKRQNYDYVQYTQSTQFPGYRVCNCRASASRLRNLWGTSQFLSWVRARAGSEWSPEV